jgi:hypothetical protein
MLDAVLETAVQQMQVRTFFIVAPIATESLHNMQMNAVWNNVDTQPS